MEIYITEALDDNIKELQALTYNLFEHDAAYDPLLKMNWPYEEGYEYFKERLHNKNAICLVAIVQNELVAFLSGSISETEPWRPIKRSELEMIYVKEKFRVKNIGKQLVEKFLAWSKTKGIQKTFVKGYTNNKNALLFYQKIGFTSLETIVETPL